MVRYRSKLVCAVPLCALAVGIGGCGSPASTGEPAAPGLSPAGAAPPEAARKEQTAMEPAPDPNDTAPRCGQPVRAPAAGPLTLTGRFPATVAATAPTVSGTVDVTSHAPVHGVGAPRADVFLVVNGRVATEPMPQDAVGVRWDLAAGQSKKVPADGVLAACEPGGDRLSPGTYQMYVRVAVTPDDGAPVTAQGGPWPLELS
ncbi:hypothetical protein [Krasilnikovia sp. M28-CT-15]|uniref:hypothetical protein n=1 Tax=Krasilnikovia sp. M28-CT-15 TaxID=3373540 RepID=UPI003875B73A